MKTMSKKLMVMALVMGVALLFSCAGAKIDPSTVRQDLDLWEEAGWAELTPAEQDLWKVLGWDEASWEGEAKQPASEDKYWNQLNAEEKAAATSLGYTKESWDEE
jgi:hypothetical protein